MGVSGAGKSRVGAGLATALGARFVDADDLHPAENVARMRAGQPLTEEARAPWLDRVAGVLAADGPVVVACSALRRAHRARLRAGAGAGLRFVHLTGPEAVIAARMAARTGHFMPPNLLASQLATLEPPGPEEEGVLTLSVEAPAEALVAQARDWLLAGG
jgi:gluconokinase